jgi:glutaconate CoA-transferase, subunit B
MSGPTRDEVMTVAAARSLKDGDLCFVGIGLPSAAANLARRLHAPDLVLIYESGTIGSRPHVLPLSIGDGELGETADAIVPLPDIFFQWLQAGRIDVGFLGGAQIDRFGNLNSTVIGPYRSPKVRLPGAGGAPEIAAHVRDVLVAIKHRRRSFVETLDFRTSPGFLHGGRARERAGLSGGGPSRVITDLGILEPDPSTRELILVATHPGVEVDEVLDATGWRLKVHPRVVVTEPVQPRELRVLRELNERTQQAHRASSRGGG